MKKFAFAAIAAFGLTAAPASAATNLVVNGGFESTTTGSANGNFQIGAYGTVTGWNTAGGNAYNLLFNSSNANSAAGNAAGTYAAPAANICGPRPRARRAASSSCSTGTAASPAPFRR